MLKRVLSGLPGSVDPNVLVGFDTSDDAGVYLLNDEIALVQTVDFFTPVVDDPYTYGQIAAANALSDVYAMGGKPLTALSIVGFPEGVLEEEILENVLRGGAQTMTSAGVSVVGGHSVKDPELKFGYAVTGTVHPDQIFHNHGVAPGDILILTKPIGTGIITTGIKFGKCPQEVATGAIDWMRTLNGPAAELLLDEKVHAVTDITGYGLLGHAFEMALSSGVCLEIDAGSVPLMDGAEALAVRGILPGGIRSNEEFIGKAVSWDGISGPLQKILLDPQTSGGLLIGIDSDSVTALLEKMRKAGVYAVTIGRVRKRRSHYLSIV